MDNSGESRYATTDFFGYYSFADLPGGETYFLTVSAKRFRFAQPSVVVNLLENLTEMNFVSEP